MEKLRITLAIGTGVTAVIIFVVSTASAKEITIEPGAPHATDSAAEEQEKRHFTVACKKPGDSANFSWEEGNVTTTSITTTTARMR